jgi:uncharacterized protein YeaO (DUF488 family)
MIKIKRVYEESEISDGQRILVDRLWPRGARKDKAHIDAWLKDLAPSHDLRQWFAHDPDRWSGFQQRYLAELKHPEKTPVLEDLLSRARRGTVTLVYAAHDQERNNAVVLKNFLEQYSGSFQPAPQLPSQSEKKTRTRLNGVAFK